MRQIKPLHHELNLPSLLIYIQIAYQSYRQQGRFVKGYLFDFNIKAVALLE
jgi:hypothetical protein